MPGESLTIRAADAAATLTTAMGSDAWQGARSGIGELFARHDPELAPAVAAELDASAAMLARADHVVRVRELLGELWRLELTRLLSRAPAAAADLATWAAAVRAELPAPARVWNQTNLAEDHGIVNAVLNGNQYVHFMDSPPESGPVSS